MLDARRSGAEGPFASDGGMEQLLTGAGFEEADTVVDQILARYEDPEHWYRWSMSVGLRSFWAQVPQDRRAEVRSQVLAQVGTLAEADGSVTVPVGVRHTIGIRP